MTPYVWCKRPSINLAHDHDKGAKRAITEKTPLSQVTYKDLTAHMKHQISNHWNIHWSVIMNNKLKEIKSDTTSRSTSYQNNQRVLCRLRIGRICLTMGHESQPTCRSCGVYITVKHVLTECITFYNERKKFRI